MLGNYEKLDKAGLILTELPEPHRKVVDDLSDDEMKVLLDVGQRLTDADVEIDAERKPAFANCIAF